MKQWNGQRLAAAAQASLHTPVRAGGTGPDRAVIDSRAVAPGELFVGLPGERTDGGLHAPDALRAGAWGVLVTPEHVDAALAAGSSGAVLSHPEPLLALQLLARAWRAQLSANGAKVVAITGSSGKTSTKDILAALLSAHMRTAATYANLNTEIGLPLTILAAPADTQALVLELAMRGAGQIALLTEIAAPDVGVIVNVGEAHLELLGSVEAIAAAKAELIAGMAPGTGMVVPANEPLLDPHLRMDLHTITFGDGGDVALIERRDDGTVTIADRTGIGARAGDAGPAAEQIVLKPSFAQAHNLLNLLAAVAAARALGIAPAGALDVEFSAMRGTRLTLAGGVTVIDDCYNANPMSMRAAIDDLARTAAERPPAELAGQRMAQFPTEPLAGPGGRRVAVLGDMLELGPAAAELHRTVAEQAAAAGVDMLVAVGPLMSDAAGAFAGERHTAPDAQQAGELLATLVRDGDTVLVKGSRGVGLERAVQRLRLAREQGRR